MPMPLAALTTRFMPPDWEEGLALVPYLLAVDRDFARDSPQHPARRWEYAMALRAHDLWVAGTARPAAHLALDVGGAGSPFHRMLAPHYVATVTLDPAMTVPAHYGDGTIENLSLHVMASALFSISVLEHVGDPYSFLEACVRHLAPGGLLFLTVDAWNEPANTPDSAHFHWMRKRIFNPETIRHTMEVLKDFGCRPFGGIDLEWRGPGVYDYSFASICMTKEREGA